MNDPHNNQYDQYFLSYTGLKLPLQLVSPLRPEDVENRNTFFGVRRDDPGRIVVIHKRVYGAIELEHLYEYHPGGALARATITNAIEDDEDERTKILTWPDVAQEA
jgi:hypothetical protein